MDALDSVVRLPDIQRKSKKQRSEAEQNAAVELMAYRYANKLDLWTGKPLQSSQTTVTETE